MAVCQNILAKEKKGKRKRRKGEGGILQNNTALERLTDLFYYKVPAEINSCL